MISHGNNQKRFWVPKWYIRRRVGKFSHAFALAPRGTRHAIFYLFFHTHTHTHTHTTDVNFNNFDLFLHGHQLFVFVFVFV